MVKYGVDDYILDRAFDALANQKRRDIITSLSLQPLSITKLAQFTSLSLPAIHKHIKILEQAELVCRRKIGRSNFLVLNHDSLLLVQDWIFKHQAHWGSAKATLDNYDPKNFTRQLSVLPESKKQKGS